MKIKTYVISILIPLAVGALAAFLTRDGMMLYDEIIQPPLAPPAIVFPIVWTILYTLMGIGCARVYLQKDVMQNAVSKALNVYALQLAFNFCWSLIFFNLRAFFAAFVWLIVLWLLVAVMLIRFNRVDKIAAIINIPYLVWLTFAAYLNLAIVILN